MKLLTFAFVLMASLLSASAHTAEVKTSWASSYALEANGLYEQAAALMVPLLEGGEHGEFALLRYGWLHYLQGNYEDAIRAYSRALTRNTRSLDARLGIVLPLLAQQRWDEAKRYLQQALGQAPSNYTAHLHLMACESGQRQWATLEKHAQRLSAFYPSDAAILTYLARAYAGQGKQNQAAATYQRVLIRDTQQLEASRFLAQ